MIYDVIIIGAGPAGSTAAFTLSNKGYKIVLLDKAIFPRHKTCGGGLSVRILNRFPYLKKELSVISRNEIKKIILHSPNKLKVTEERDEPLYLMVNRSEFDNMLLEMCRNKNIDIMENMTVRSIIQYRDCVKIITNLGEEIKGKILIGADGAGSITAKEVGLNKCWKDDELALVMTGRIEYENQNYEISSTMHVFYAHNYQYGYGYIFPKDKYVDIGLGFLLSFFKDKIKGNFHNEYNNFIQYLYSNKLIECINNKIHTAIVPVAGPLDRTFSERVMLCGDAAGFVNAFTAEGIFYAMASGEHAAKVALLALEKNDFSSEYLSQYQLNWYREFGNEIKQSVKIQKTLFKNMKLIDYIVKFANQDQKLRRILVDFSIGQISYRSLTINLLLRFFPFYFKYKLYKIKELIS